LKKLGIEPQYLNTIACIYYKRTDTIWDIQKLKSFYLRSGVREGCLFSQISFNLVLEFLARTIRQVKERKDIHIEKQEIKFSLAWKGGGGRGGEGRDGERREK
jgi:hypothetical protein